MTTLTKAGTAIVSEASTRPAESFEHGTLDLMGAFTTLERNTGTFYSRTPMSPARRKALVEELVQWSTGGAEDFDWAAVDEINPTAPDDFRP